MNTEPTKLPMRKLIDFMESRAQDPVPTNGKNFFQELLSIAEELEVEELTLLGDAHYDGMDQMRSLIDQQNLIENTNGYIKEKFDKELPDDSGSIENLVEFGNGTKMIISGVYPPIHDGNALFERATKLFNVKTKP